MNAAITIVVNLAITALFAYFVYDITAKYKAAEGTWYSRLWASVSQSGTVLWLRFVSIVASGIDSLVWVADALNAPQVASAMQTYGNPAVWAKVILTITIVGEIVRRRKGSSDPVSG